MNAELQNVNVRTCRSAFTVATPPQADGTAVVVRRKCSIYPGALHAPEKYLHFKLGNALSQALELHHTYL